VGLFVDKLDTEESEADKAKGQAGAVALDRYFQARDKQSKPPHDAQPDLKTQPTEALEKEEQEEEEGEEETSRQGGGDTAKRKSVESAEAVSGTEPASGGPQPKRPKAVAPAKSPGDLHPQQAPTQPPSYARLGVVTPSTLQGARPTRRSEAT
jgi:hypothetical protein